MWWGFSTTKSSDSYIKEMERVFEIEGDLHFLFFYILGRVCRTSSVPWGPQWKSIFSASMGVSSVYGGCRQNGKKRKSVSAPRCRYGGQALSSIFSFLFIFVFQGLEYFRAHSRDKRIPCLLSGQGY